MPIGRPFRWLVGLWLCAACGGAPAPAGDDDGGELVDDGVDVDRAGAPRPPRVRLNEVETSGGAPGDWVELINAEPVAIDLGGWQFKDADDTHVFTFPAGATIAAGGLLLLEQATWGFSLNDAETARLYDPQGQLVDSFAWASSPTTSYGRCPDGRGAFAVTESVTKGVANDCSAAPPPAGTEPWPGRDVIATVDANGAFPANISDLLYVPGAGAEPDVMWAVRNEPSALYRLAWNGAVWARDAAAGWSSSRPLRYPGGAGHPDAEALARTDAAPDSIYVAAERNNDAVGVSRLSVLRYDLAAAGAELVAAQEWDVTADLPAVNENLGFEAMTWVPDTALVAGGFVDESTGRPYDPAQYPDHGDGLFFLGLEANGVIYVYALDHASGGFHRIASITSGLPLLMSLQFDRDAGYLWSACDNSCSNRLTVLTIDTTPGSPAAGNFVVRRAFARPSSLPNSNHEGVALAPQSRCADNALPFYWVDDSVTSGHALRADTIPCGPFIP